MCFLRNSSSTLRVTQVWGLVWMFRSDTVACWMKKKESPLFLFCSLKARIVHAHGGKHRQTVIFSLFRSRDRGTLNHTIKGLHCRKPNSCIFITFSICAESRGPMQIHTLRFLPSADPLRARFVFPPLINKQVGCAFASSPRLKSHFHYCVTCSFFFFHLEGKLFYGTTHADHRPLFGTFLRAKAGVFKL